MSGKKGTEKEVELATGNEHKLRGCFVKVWTTFLEQILFYKMNCTWNPKAWIQVLTQTLIWPGCLLSLSLSFASMKSGWWKYLYCLPFRTVGRAHWGHTLWKCVSTIWVIRMDKWYLKFVWTRETSSTVAYNGETFPHFHLYLDQRPLNSYSVAHIHWGKKGIPVLGYNL